MKRFDLVATGPGIGLTSLLSLICAAPRAPFALAHEGPVRSNRTQWHCGSSVRVVFDAGESTP